MTHSIAALGLSARPYFNRYTDDAIDLCDVLSSFTSQAKVTLHELCRILGLLGKPDNIDGGEVEKYFREGPAARGGGGARRRPQLRRRSIWSGWIVRSDGAARAPENDDDAGQEPRWRRRVGRRDVRDASRLCSSHIGRRRRSPRAPLTLCQLGNAFCHRYGTKSIPPTPNRSAAMSHGVKLVVTPRRAAGGQSHPGLMPQEKAPSSRALLPASLMYFCSGQLMHFCSGVDSFSSTTRPGRRSTFWRATA